MRPVLQFLRSLAFALLWTVAILGGFTVWFMWPTWTEQWGSSQSQDGVNVKGHTKKDGTQVRPHTRKKPGR
jgi:hypothetical protein